MKQCMNFKFVILFALTLLVGSTVYGQDNVLDEVVWVVGDEAILNVYGLEMNFRMVHSL